jgi:hypothetical protein
MFPVVVLLDQVTLIDPLEETFVWVFDALCTLAIATE